MLVKSVTQLARRSVFQTPVRNQHFDQLGLAGAVSTYMILYYRSHCLLDKIRRNNFSLIHC